MARELTIGEQQLLSQLITQTLPKTKDGLISGFVLSVVHNTGLQTISNMPDEDQVVLLEEVLQGIKDGSLEIDGEYHPPSHN